MVKAGSVKIENLLIGLTSTPRRFKAAGNVKVEQTAFESADHRAGGKAVFGTTELVDWILGFKWTKFAEYERSFSICGVDTRVSSSVGWEANRFLGGIGLQIEFAMQLRFTLAVEWVVALHTLISSELLTNSSIFNLNIAWPQLARRLKPTKFCPRGVVRFLDELNEKCGESIL